ncbi:MAG: IS1096 element passenger TnpR family protein [Blastocatellia bacterium]
MPAKKAHAKKTRVFTFEVYIIGGPMTKAFMRAHRSIGRTIRIRGDQTLERFHKAIFAAFDREQEHMYEFQVGGKGPDDPDARRYVLFSDADEVGDNGPAGGVKTTRIDTLGLVENDVLGYWFDFGDDWWHQINVLSIEDVAKPGRLPRVVKKVGPSPPQYIDWDAESEDEDADEE